METTSHQVDSEIQTSNDDSILNFRDELLAREILGCGIGKTDRIVHFGSGFYDSLMFSYLSDLKSQNLIPGLEIEYTAVDIEDEKISKVKEINSNLDSPINVHLYNTTIQSFLDSNQSEFEWSIITGIFDKRLYGEKQFEFLDKILGETLKISTEGIIFTFDTQKENDDNYSIQHILSYIDSVYSRYKVSRINEFNYVICVNKYFHSIIPQ